MAHQHLFGIPVFWYLVGGVFVYEVLVIFGKKRFGEVGKYCNIINTLIHELGHALMSLILHGKVSKIQVFKDTSGVTTTGSDSKFKSILVSLAGYTFASAAALCCFFLLSVGYEKWIIVGLSVTFLIMLIFWIHNNWFGDAWVLAFILINVMLLYFWCNDSVTEAVAWIYSTIMLVESVWSTFELVHISVRTPEKAGDATNLHKFAYLPSLIWAVLFALFSIWMAYLSLVQVHILPK